MGKMKVVNVGRAGAQQQSQQESVSALEMHLHLLGLTAEIHTDPKPPHSTEFSPRSREGKVEERERIRLSEHCGCAAVGKSPQAEREERRGTWRPAGG